MNSGSVKKSVTIDADLEKVWTKISKITKLDWLEGQKSTKSVSYTHLTLPTKA